jgi:hypothetical protein
VNDKPILKPEHEKRFNELVAGLNALRASIARYFPHANYYLAEDTLHLMSGPSHGPADDEPHYGSVNTDAHPERSLCSRRIAHSSGGDW